MDISRTASRLSDLARSYRWRRAFPPGHFYSPIWGAEDTERARVQRSGLEEADAYDLRGPAQLELANSLGPAWARFSGSWRRYHPDNDFYRIADGAVYYSMLTTLRPRNVIEVGSGFSSAVALDARDEQLLDLKLTFIEPYPDRLHQLLHARDRSTTTMYYSPLQDVPLSAFDVLEADDILFIDSTHVSKAGSDVNWLFFRILPRLKPGVVVHIHDVFFPFEYIDAWLTERRSWNESYLLRAFLSFNDTFQILFFNSWIWQKHPDVVRRYLPEATGEEPAGIWLRRAR